MESEEEWSGVECGTEWVEWRDEFSVWSLLTVTGVVVVLLVVASDVWAAIWLAGFGLVWFGLVWLIVLILILIPIPIPIPIPIIGPKPPFLPTGRGLFYCTVPDHTILSEVEVVLRLTIPQYHNTTIPRLHWSPNSLFQQHLRLSRLHYSTLLQGSTTWMCRQQPSRETLL